MDSSQYLPDSVSSSLLTKRAAEGGLYDHLKRIISGMEKSALCHLEYGVHFFRQENNNWSTTTTYRSNDSMEFTTNIFGEVVGSKYGTILGPDGNHWPGNNLKQPNAITDSSPVKQVIVLGKPSFCDEVLENFYRNQVCVFDKMRNADEREEEEDGLFFDAKQIIRKKVYNEEACLIALHGANLYTIEREQASSAKSGPREVMKKRRADGSSNFETEKKNSPPIVAVGESSKQAVNPALLKEDVRNGRPIKDHELPGHETIRVGAKYSPWTLPGYGGLRFQQRFAQVIQLDWRDAKNRLIPPWNVWDELRPGTLVMATVSINVYIMPARDPAKPKRKIYQALIKNLRVVGRSDIWVSKPVTGESNVDRAGAALRSVDDDLAFKELSAIVLPEDGSVDDNSTTASEGSAHGTQDGVAEDESSIHGDGIEGETGKDVQKESGKELDVSMAYLEDIEPEFIVNTRKSKKSKRG
ncbi:hypothetical protein PM082_001904 [Marasmius tenuissimus]|nr:hypothetical protein PM082_001904 [Marasmius tenuissimus]